MAILGNGDIANALKELPNKEDFLFMASGVSNSQETRESEYQREIDLLLDQPRASHIVYFSSLGVFDRDTRYFRHKRDMEIMVKTNFPKNTIVRLPNISWGDNPHTLVNYLRNHPRAEIRNEWRCIVDKDEFLYWIDKIPDFSCEMSIIGRRLKVKDIMEEIKKGKL